MPTSPSRRTRHALGGVATLALCALVSWLLRGSPTTERATPEPMPKEREESVVVAAPRVHVAPPAPETIREPAHEPETAAVALAEPDAPSEPPAEPLTLIVRDVWNGREVVGVPLALTTERSAAELAAAGRANELAPGRFRIEEVARALLRIPAASVGDPLESLDAEWRVVGRSRPDATNHMVVWVARSLLVEGSVRIVDASAVLAFDDIEILACSNGADSYVGGAATADTTPDEPWLAAQRLGDLGVLGRPDADGRFAFTIPRLRSTTIRARVRARSDAAATGWRDAAFTIPDAMARSGTARVVLELERGYVLSGRVVDEDGNPVVGVRVTLHIVRRVDRSALVPAELRKMGLGYSANWHPGMPQAIVDHAVRGSTGAGGRFELAARIDGELTISLAPATEHHVENIAVGSVSGYSRSDAFVVRSARDVPPVRLVGPDGTGFPGRQVLFNDLSAGDIQPCYSRRLGTDSAIPGRFLVAGRRYAFTVLPEEGSLPIAEDTVVWRGEREIVVRPFNAAGKVVEEAGGR